MERKATTVITVMIIAMIIALPPVSLSSSAIESLDSGGDPTVIAVVPPIIEVRLGETFTINVTVTNVTDLFAWQVVMVYNSIILNYTDAGLPSGHVFDGEPHVFPTPKVKVINETSSFVTIAATLFAPPTFNGSGILCQINFTGANSGTSPLHIAVEPVIGWQSKLLDSEEELIPFAANDGEVTVTGLKLSTAVYFNLNPNPTGVGETLTLKGILVDELSQHLSSETVKVYARPLAGSWRYITSLTTNGYGIFMWGAKIPMKGTFIFAVYYPGSETYERSYNFAILIVQ